MTKHVTWFPAQGGGRGGGVLRISSDRDDRMGAKIKPPKKSLVLQTKPPKIPEPKCNPQKLPRRISKAEKFPEAAGIRELSRIFRLF